MTAYVLFLREGAVADEGAMAEYLRRVGANPPDPKLAMLSFYGNIDPLEGRAPDGVVLLQFPTLEDARAWYHGPAYQAAAPHRIRSAEYRAFIFEGP